VDLPKSSARELKTAQTIGVPPKKDAIPKTEVSRSPMRGARKDDWRQHYFVGAHCVRKSLLPAPQRQPVHMEHPLSHLLA
jgi:hypothetical protein